MASVTVSEWAEGFQPSRSTDLLESFGFRLLMLSATGPKYRGLSGIKEYILTDQDFIS